MDQVNWTRVLIVGASMGCYVLSSVLGEGTAAGQGLIGMAGMLIGTLLPQVGRPRK